MSTGPSTPAAFQDVLAAMAQVDRLKSREQVLALEADLPARVADVAARIKEVYARQGLAVSDATIAEGVEQFFSQRLVFQEPKPTLGARLAVLWVHRTRLLIGGTALTAAVCMITAGIYFGVVVPAREAQEREVRAARRQIETAAEKLHSSEKVAASVFAHTQQELAKVAQAAGDRELPKAAAVAESQLATERAAFDETVKRAEENLATYTPVERITFERIPAALAVVRQTLDAVQTTGREIDRAASLLPHLAALRADRVSLETAWQRLDHAGVPAGLKSSGEQIYAKGLAVVTAFGVTAEVKEAATLLQALADTEVRLRTLPTEIRTAAAAARTASRDPRADEQITTAERTGLAAVESGDAAAGGKTLAALHALTAQLGEVYTLRIVNRPREYTRFWRYPNGSTSIKNYYVVVEAVAPDGHPVAVSIRSEENGSTALVNKWAERVDEATYNDVGKDKQDDGIVQKNTFGQKDKGRLDPIYLMGTKTRGGDSEAGRINRWDYRG